MKTSTATRRLVYPHELRWDGRIEVIGCPQHSKDSVINRARAAIGDTNRIKWIERAAVPEFMNERTYIRFKHFGVLYDVVEEGGLVVQVYAIKREGGEPVVTLENGVGIEMKVSLQDVALFEQRKGSGVDALWGTW